MPKGGITTDFIFLTIAIVGTTIAPWQLFFQQSCVADKKLRFADLKWARLDTFIGACFTVVVGGCQGTVALCYPRSKLPSAAFRAFVDYVRMRCSPI